MGFFHYWDKSINSRSKYYYEDLYFHRDLDLKDFDPTTLPLGYSWNDGVLSVNFFICGCPYLDTGMCSEHETKSTFYRAERPRTRNEINQFILSYTFGILTRSRRWKKLHDGRQEENRTMILAPVYAWRMWDVDSELGLIPLVSDDMNFWADEKEAVCEGILEDDVEPVGVSSGVSPGIHVFKDWLSFDERTSGRAIGIVELSGIVHFYARGMKAEKAKIIAWSANQYSIRGFDYKSMMSPADHLRGFSTKDHWQNKIKVSNINILHTIWEHLHKEKESCLKKIGNQGIE